MMMGRMILTRATNSVRVRTNFDERRNRRRRSDRARRGSLGLEAYFDRTTRGFTRESADDDDDDDERFVNFNERKRESVVFDDGNENNGNESNKVPLFSLDGEEAKEIFALAVPAVGALLADPLMSLIDTAFVGRLGVKQLTALGPNAAIFQIIFQLFSFLSICTTGMVARHHAKASVGCDTAEYKIRRSVSISIFFSILFGLFSALILNCFSERLLTLVGTPENLISIAAPYLKVRALATPFVLLSYCAQGAFIGKLDSKTPLRIFASAAILNIILNIILVPTYGLKGAAIATLFAQVASAVMFCFQLFMNKMLPKFGSEEWTIPPTALEVSRITKVSSALFLSSICRMGVYTMMTTTALYLGNAVMAAHQIALNVFWSLTYFVDPLFVASTSFIARDFDRDPRKSKTIAKTLLALSLIVGIFVAFIAFMVSTFGSGAFTMDAQVQTLVRSISVYMLLSQFVSAVVFVSEGILIGSGDARYLLRAHILNFVTLFFVLLAVREFALGLKGIWFAVLSNQIIRLAQHAHRTLINKNGPDIFLIRP